MGPDFDRIYHPGRMRASEHGADWALNSSRSEERVRAFLSFLFRGIVWLVLTVAVGGASGAFAQEASCVSCHGDKALLRSQSPRWRDLYVDPSQFSRDKHGSVECIACHGKDRYKSFPHSTVVSDPRDPADPRRIKDTCGKCHEETTARHLTSLHSTLEGHKSSLMGLLGQKEGLDRFATCTSCHATCTDCHFKQPDRYNRLVPRTESHRFTRRPPAAVCAVCHAKTGESYLGGRGSTGHGPSVMAAAGLECMDCHTEKEVHGSGKGERFMGSTGGPTCEKCHAKPASSIQTAKGTVTVPHYDPLSPAHRIHEDEVGCVACHTRWYTNCWDCHKGKAREEKGKFYLAVNPVSGKVHTAVHVPIGSEIGGVPPEEGGWAVKTSHSWGKSQPCEKCHTEPGVYIDPELRQARFVGSSSKEEANASFLDEKLVERITIDREGLARSVHKDLSCEACHGSRGDEACARCHDRGKNPRPRALYLETDDLLRREKRSLTEARTLSVELFVWEKHRTDLRDRYLETANGFHSDPAAAGSRIRSVLQAAKEFDQELARALSKAHAQGRGTGKKE